MFRFDISRASGDESDSSEWEEDDDSQEGDGSDQGNDDTNGSDASAEETESEGDYDETTGYDDSDFSNGENESDYDDYDNDDGDSDSDFYNEFEDYAFINAGDIALVPFSAPTLEEMASLSIAIALWNHASGLSPEFVTFANCDDEDDGEELRKKIKEWTSQLPLPKLFASRIETFFSDVVDEVDLWIEYHREEIFLQKKKEFEPDRYKRYIVWNSNPTINYYLTALNLLKSHELSDLEKYRLCCTYCLKEEIENRWQTLAANKVLLNDKKKSSKNPLVDYWNYYCAGELHMMKTRQDLPVDEFMVRMVNNWPALEYFFDRLDAEKQVENAICIIDQDVPRYQKLILLKLNECQRLQVYAESVVPIIRNYAGFSDEGIYVSNAISTWYEVRDLINQDQFFSLLEALCSSEALDVVLMEIWTSAYIELKRHVCTLSNNYDFIADVFMWAAHKESEGFDFLFAVLTDGAKMSDKPQKAPTEMGKIYFYKLCRKMISNCELESLDRFLNLCVPDAEQCAEFKILLAKKSYTNACCKKLIKEHEFSKVEQVLTFFHLENIPESKQIVHDLLLENLKHIDDYCLSFYTDGNVKALNAALAPLQSSYPEVILEYKKYLLFSDKGLEACCSHFNSPIDILTEIVADGLPDAREAIQFGKKIIFSKLGISKLLTLIRDENFPNAFVKQIVNLFLKSNKDKRKLKTKLSYSITPEELRTDRAAKKKYLRALNALF